MPWTYSPLCSVGLISSAIGHEPRQKFEQEVWRLFDIPGVIIFSPWKQNSVDIALLYCLQRHSICDISEAQDTPRLQR